ncbi:DUF11 domain-containing protein [Thalassotalea sp. Y01]|uniref:DUF11 domain-containing protein n=1 Tax=Thalassotalea sp. Y01 TaxID=2729613 RepID=UPI00145E0EC7|nr:DUF11 domain-containing protein [Thalassotalea sp. Y01]NMP14911.1 hypothetical protein [Thalassotalea sp. Y01]
MDIQNSKRLTRTIKACLFSIPIVGMLSIPTTKAEIFPNLESEKCMADAYLLEPGNSLPSDALNCTANDVEITQVDNISVTECTPGQVITFNADLTVQTNAKERYDTTFYLPLTEQSPQMVQADLGTGAPTGVAYPDYCSIALPKSPNPDVGAYVDIDTDRCGDIEKSGGVDSYQLIQQPVTMLCIDKDGDNRADFNYCAAWDNIERDNCTEAADPYPGQIPNTKSKCNCDTFNIDIFIRPDPPMPTKTPSGVVTRPEPGGAFSFDYSFTNTSSASSLFITSLTDEIDITGDGNYDVSVDLWSTPVTAGSTDGIYLTASTCQKPASGETSVEIAPSATYSCSFTVTIVDTDLPNDQSPEKYDDTVVAMLVDKNGAGVGDPTTCPVGLAAAADETCSDVERVTVTNLPPDISVTKTPSKTSVLEPGENVEFTIVVTNNSGAFDSPVTLDTLTDSDFGNLVGNGDCATGGTIAMGGTYTCKFTEMISGDFGDPAHQNTVTAIASDNEGDTDTAMNSATVSFTDVPSMIDLVKTVEDAADGTTYMVEETGDNPTLVRTLSYKYRFSVDGAGVDSVTFDKLEDLIDTANAGGALSDLTSSCLITEDSDGAVASAPLSSGYTLLPGEWASCEIDLDVQGNKGYTWTNVAKIYGTDSDGAMLNANDDADVQFTDVPLQVTPKVAFKLNAYVVLANGGVDNVDITNIKIGGVTLADGATVASTFIVRNESVSGYAYGAETSLSFCSFAADPDILVGGTYKCAFTLELLPGFDPAGADVNAALSGLNGLVITVADDDGGAPVDIVVDITVQTMEP